MILEGLRFFLAVLECGTERPWNRRISLAIDVVTIEIERLTEAA